MWQWLAENHLSLSVVASLGTLLVWLVYLGIFMRQYRRQTQPKIVINRAAGRTLDANCFISNMSSEAVYLEAIIVTLEDSDKTWSGTATDIYSPDGDGAPSDPRQRTHQGPLHSGDYLSIGTFRSLLDRVREANPELGDDPLSDFPDPKLRVKILADYASEDLVIGAERRFGISREGDDWVLQALYHATDQIRSRRRRRRAEAELRERA